VALAPCPCQWGCDEADCHGWDTYVLASPAGSRLYRKFGFKNMGAVRTVKGTFTSMLRKARSEVGTRSLDSTLQIVVDEAHDDAFLHTNDFMIKLESS
jgi:hypothetical protein